MGKAVIVVHKGSGKIERKKNDMENHTNNTLARLDLDCWIFGCFRLRLKLTG
jgi:hypothetical protein